MSLSQKRHLEPRMIWAVAVELNIDAKMDLQGRQQPQRLFLEELPKEKFLKASKFCYSPFPPWHNG